VLKLIARRLGLGLLTLLAVSALIFDYLLTGPISGVAGLTVTISSDSRGRLRALLRFYDLPQNPGIPSGTYRLTGRFTTTSRQVALIPQRWIVQPPRSCYCFGPMRAGLWTQPRAVQFCDLARPQVRSWSRLRALT